MRINELTREAVEPAKPLQILPQGVQTPPPANPLPAPAAVKPAPAAVNPAPAAVNPVTAKPGAAAGIPAAPGLVVPNNPKGIVSKAQLDQFRQDSGNPKATLGQFMNQQQGKTFRKGGANDPAVIAARQQPAGPAVGSQAQTAGGRNELAKVGIAAGSPALQPQQAAAPAPAATPGTAAAPSAFNQGSLGTRAPATEPAPLSVVSRNDGVPPPLPAAPAAAPAPNSGSGYAGGVGNVPDFGVRGTPILPYGQGSPVGGTTNAVTRTDAEIGDKGVPGSFDKNRAQGEKNLNALKGLFGGNKQPAAPAAAPAAGNAAALIPPANPNPLRGQFAESTGMQDPVLVRMQNLAGIRR
jgi:hypothetical protein